MKRTASDMKRTAILAAVMATMVASGAMAQNDPRHWRPGLAPSTPVNVTNNSSAGSQPPVTPGHLPGSIPACQPKVYLSRYRLIGWQGYVPDRYVGGSQEKVSTVARLAELRDDRVAACTTDGNEMRAETRKRLQDDHNRRMAEFDDFWGNWGRQFVVRVHNDNVWRMTKWYEEGISTCRNHFTGDFNALSPQLCR